MKEVILHHSLTKDAKVVDFNAIKRYHIHTNGWRDIGYHYIIEFVNGSVRTFKGRSTNVSGAHTKGHNDSIGVCVVGNFDLAPPSQEHMEELYKLLDDLEKEFGGIEIKGHCDYSYKTCPGKKFPLETVKARYSEEKSSDDIKWHWAESEIRAILKYGLMSGYPDGSFKPDEPLTRAQYAYMKAKELDL